MRLDRTIKYLKATGIHVRKGKQRNLCFLVIICQKPIVTFESSIREAGRVADPAEMVLIICLAGTLYVNIPTHVHTHVMHLYLDVHTY